VIVERVAAAYLPVIMCGAGHIGQAIAKAALDLPFALAWFDVRTEAAGAPELVIADEGVLLAAARAAGPDDVVLVLTHDHALDFRLTVAALHSRSGFVGLIGSATKRARFVSRLAKEGIDGPALDRLICPIGLQGVVGKEPAVIAIAVMAQLLSLRTAPC
jgi:xanthine dehydrogenase accessory factor